jgi:hypothetical protein
MPLLDGTAVPDAAAEAYAAPAGGVNQGVIIAGLRVVNISTAPILLSLWVVPSGGARTDANKIANVGSIPADGFDHVFLKAVMLEPGDAVHWLGGVAASLSGRIDGVKMET